MEKQPAPQDLTTADNSQPNLNLSRDLTGETVGDFRLLRRLGQGGMGQVYLAKQVSLDRKVALKLLRADLASNQTALQRFQQEAKAVAKATHPNIVQVYHVGEENGIHYMALEYVEGKNLREYLEKKGPPETLISLSILKQAASALHRASELGVIHRDIKPENILLTKKGEVKVADFGLARIFDDSQQTLNLTKSNVSMGTPLYMSPEQVENKPVDPRTDIYSLGVTAYHMLAGHPPYRGQTPFEVAVQHVQGTAEYLADIRPDLPAELCRIVHKMMEKNPENRYQTARDVVRDLQRLRDSLIGTTGTQPVLAWTSHDSSIPEFAQSPHPALQSTTPYQEPPTPAKPPRRTWRIVGTLGLLLLLGLGLGLWAKNRNAQPQEAKNEGKTNTEQVPQPKTEKPNPSPDKLEETKLLWVFDQYVKSGDKSKRPTIGMDAAIDLVQFYLEHDRPDDAYRVCKQLQEIEDTKQSKFYRYIGGICEGIVWAFKDEPEKSNQILKGMLRKRKGAPRHPILLLRDQLVAKKLGEPLAKALKRNQVNGGSIPPELERYLEPPTPETGDVLRHRWPARTPRKRGSRPKSEKG